MLSQKRNLPEGRQQQQTKKRSFKCLQCHRYARDPVLTHCGHMFCWSCLYKQAMSNSQCPHCKQTCILPQCYPVYTDFQQDQSQQSIRQEKQQCSNSQNQLSCHDIQQKQSSLTLPLNKVEIPCRPAAKHHQKILNPNMIGAGLPIASSNLPSNVNMGKLIAGNVFISPLGINAFSSIQDGEEADEDYDIGQKFKLRMHLAAVVIILLLAYFLLV